MPVILDKLKTFSEGQIEEALASGQCKLTAKQLASVKTNTNKTALHVAAEKGLLTLIKIGVTVDDLYIDKSENEEFPLHFAARHGHLDQIIGGVTISQLAGCSTYGGTSALDVAIASGHANQISCTETARQLAKFDRNQRKSPFHSIATHGLYSLIKGGISVAQLKKSQR